MELIEPESFAPATAWSNGGDLSHDIAPRGVWSDRIAGFTRMSDNALHAVEARYPGMDEHTAIEWLMATSDGTAIDSWHWLIEFTPTSFYFKSMNRALQAMKVSIHGPDDRHPGMDHFRFDVVRDSQMEVDQRAANRSARDGGRWLTDFTELPYHFEGETSERACQTNHAIQYGRRCFPARSTSGGRIRFAEEEGDHAGDSPRPPPRAPWDER